MGFHVQRWGWIGLLALAGLGCKGGDDSDTESDSDSDGPGACPVDCDATGVESDCAAVVDNAGDAQFVLRVAQLDVAAPTALGTGLIADVLADSFLPDQPECTLEGGATADWLLRFDLANRTVMTGSGAIAGDGFCFVDASPIRPAQVDASVEGGVLASAGPFDVVFDLDYGGQRAPLPLRGARFTNVTLSDDQNCIGALDPDALDPGDCAPIEDAPRFATGGTLTGHITLEDADAVVITALNESLCVLLTGDVGAGNPRVCARDGEGAIVATGDWCDATDSAEGCADAMRFEAAFAASAVPAATNCGS